MMHIHLFVLFFLLKSIPFLVHLGTGEAEGDGSTGTDEHFPATGN